jgi:hypothetical protein
MMSLDGHLYNVAILELRHEIAKNDLFLECTRRRTPQVEKQDQEQA